MNYKNKLFLLIFILATIFILSCSNSEECGNNECEWSGDYKETYSTCSADCKNCDDKNSCTEDNYDYTTRSCKNTKIENCCGNNDCESFENPLNCDEDCFSKLTISRQEIRVNDESQEAIDTDRKMTRVEYIEGEKYKLDELYADTNVGSFHASIKNSGTYDIKNMYATAECIDATYSKHSRNVCYIIPNKMSESVCEIIFSGSNKKIIFEGDLTESDRVTHFPVGTSLSLTFYISGIQNLEHFRIEPDQETFHELDCDINLLSDETNLKETISINNYFLRGDLSRFTG